VKSLICEVCGKGFKTNQDLRRHDQIHTKQQADSDDNALQTHQLDQENMKETNCKADFIAMIK